MQVSLHRTSGVTRLKDAFQIPAQLAQRSARPDCAQGIQLQKRPLNRFCLAGRQFHRVAERRYPHRLAPIVGSPVKVVRPLTEAEVEGLRKSTQSCVSNWKRFATGLQTGRRYGQYVRFILRNRLHKSACISRSYGQVMVFRCLKC